MKSLLTGSALAFVLMGTGLVQAGETTSQGHIFDGPYLGANLNYVNGKSKFNKQLVAANRESLTADLGGDGVEGGLHLGYGYVEPTSKIYVGAELRGAYSGLSGKYSEPNTTDNPRASLKKKFSYGVNVHLGLAATEKSLIALKVGVVRARWKLNTSYDISGLENRSKSSDKTGLELGVIGRMALNDCWTVGVEGTYQKFSKFSHAHGTYAQHTVEPRNLSVGLRFGYQFKDFDFF